MCPETLPDIRRSVAAAGGPQRLAAILWCSGSDDEQAFALACLTTDLQQDAVSCVHATISAGLEMPHQLFWLTQTSEMNRYLLIDCSRLARVFIRGRVVQSVATGRRVATRDWESSRPGPVKCNN